MAEYLDKILSNSEEEDEAEEEEEDDDSDDDQDDPQEIPQLLPRPNAVYNTVGLHEKLEEIGWPGDVDWIQTLTINYDQPGEIDVNDDLAREMAFYTQALDGTREAFGKLQALGIPFLRPEDYYAEMVKTDTHMLKVKDMLLSQQKQSEEADERRKSREAKRFSKEVQSQKIKERAKQKKQDIDSVKKWRKMRQNSGFTKGEDDFPVDFEDGPPSTKKRKFNAATRDKSGGKAGGSIGDFNSNNSFEDGPPSTKKRKFNAAPWDRSGGKNGGSPGGFKRNKAGNTMRQGGKAPWDRPGGKHDGSPGAFKSNKAGNMMSKGRKAPWDRPGGKSGESPVAFKSNKAGTDRGSKSRQYKNAKFGHGGKKSFNKKNTAESSADIGGFKGGFKGKKGKKQKR